MGEGIVVSVNVSENRGTPKNHVGSSRVVYGFGLEGDAHGGDWHRQVSLLSEESIESMRRAGTEAYPGRFAENITTSGIAMVELPVGTRIRLGSEVVLEITMIRKAEDDPTAVYYYDAGVKKPLDVVFARVDVPGVVSRGDPITVLENGSE